MNDSATFIANKLLIKLRKCEVNVHMKTLKGGYADVIIIGKEVYELLIPEIKERLQEVYGDKIILKPKMYNPFIRYIWFGDNEHFVETGTGTIRVLDPHEPIGDQERHINLKREYLLDGFDNENIQNIIQ